MKLRKTASGKKTIKMSKSEWQEIGKTAGWDESEEDKILDKNGEEIILPCILETTKPIQGSQKMPYKYRSKSKPLYPAGSKLKAYDAVRSKFPPHKWRIRGCLIGSGCNDQVFVNAEDAIITNDYVDNKTYY